MKNNKYEYWDKVLSKNEKVVREKHRRKIFDIFPSKFTLDRLYKKGKLTEEQYEDLMVRTNLYQIIRISGYATFKKDLAHIENNKYIQKYYYEVNTEEKHANGKTFSEMFNN